MKKLRYKTRGDSSPRGKAKIWLCAHPEDIQKYLDPIAADLLNAINGALWYDDDPSTDWEEQEVAATLEEMQLLVIPVTTRLLTTSNPALDLEIPFARSKNIPILPLMQEDGLEQLFNEKCGELQFLNPRQKESTALSYEEKLKNYLSSVLVGDELAEKVRAAFDAYIFLSYRKKDLRFAQDLMRLIHSNDFCRDIAIWYDEYLIPGENFNSAIAKALNKCDLFALAVTPNLINEVNYVMTTEYPEALKTGKPIVAAELQTTDREQLKSHYENIPDCIDPYDQQALSKTLKDTLMRLAIKENDRDPKHNFFIGLAYLSGIDVEVDLPRALTLLEGSADAGLADAISKLASMYRNGAGVERDLSKAILRQEQLVALYQKEYEEAFTEETSDRLLHAVWALGDDWYQLRNLEKTKEQYAYLHQLGAAALEKFNNVKSRRDLSVGCFKLGDLLEMQGNLAEAEKMYQQAVEYRREIADIAKTKQSRRELFAGLIKLGDISKGRYDLSSAEKYYQQAKMANDLLPKEDPDARHQHGTYLERLGEIYFRQGMLQKAESCFNELLAISFSHHQEMQSVDSHRSVMIAYHKCGMIPYCQENFSKAKSLFEKALEIAKSLADETQTIGARHDLAICIAQLGEVFMAEGEDSCALERLEQALGILVPLLEKVPAAEHYHDTITTQQKVGDLHLRNQRIAAAAEAYEKAQEWCQAFMERSDMTDACYDMLICCERLGDLCRLQGDPQSASQLYQKGIQCCQSLSEEACTADLLRSLAISYTKWASLLKEQGDLAAAKELYHQALSISTRGNKAIDNKKYYQSQLIIYANLHDIYQAEQNPEKAKEMLLCSLKITESILGGHCDLKERIYLATLCLHLGNSFAKEQEDTAAGAYEKSIHLCSALAEETKDLYVHRTLRESLSALGRLRKRQENLPLAAELFQRALKEASFLAEQTHSPADQNALATAHYNFAFVSNTKKEHLTRALELWSSLCVQFPEEELYAKRKALVLSKLEQ